MSQSVNKPNFLYIMTDQLRADWLGCYGHPVVKTPNIDALAAQGARFEKFYVATPVCMPNRASFMTGRFPSVHGLRYNGCLLSKRANTFVDVLKAGGYATATMGKSHLQPFTEIEAQLPKAVSDEAPIKEAWKTEPHENYILEQPEKYRDDTVFEFPTPYYGFDHVDVVTGHGSASVTQTGRPYATQRTSCRTTTAVIRGTAHRYRRRAIPQPTFASRQRTTFAAAQTKTIHSSLSSPSRTRIIPSTRRANTGTCTTRTTLTCPCGSRTMKTRRRP